MNLKNKKWSFSSVKLYDTCPYAFYLKYVEDVPDKPNAFAQHGSFVHKILERYFKGELIEFELADIFESEYEDNVTERFPFFNMYKSYYDKTLEYLQNFDGIKGKVIGVEQEVESVIGGYKFIGYIDLVMKDDKGIFIVDHKSHSEFKSKKERAEYYRQLYLYARCIKDKYGEFPYKLVFNRFRILEKPLDEEIFNEDDYKSATSWFGTSIDKIFSETNWDCNINKFFCDSLCGLDECVYCGGQYEV